MSEPTEARKSRISATQVSIAVAALSLCTALYQGYLNTRAVAVFSHDATHRETMRACRETVEFYMDAKLRIGRIGEAASGVYTPRERADIVFEARRAVARFAAVATYLANFSEETRRARYTDITQKLDAIVETGGDGKPADFSVVDKTFYTLNEDCVASVGMAGK